MTGLSARFAPKPDNDVRPRREGLLDLDVDVLGEAGPAEPENTAERYAACDHAVTSRHGRTVGPVDDAPAAMGLVRNTAVAVASFNTAMSIAAATELIALIPSSSFEHLRARSTLRSVPLPAAWGGAGGLPAAE